MYHNLVGWSHEFSLIIQNIKCKGNRTTILKLVVTESIYEIWRYRNDTSFENVVHNKSITEKVIDTIVYRGWSNRKLRAHIARLMFN